VRYLPVSTDGLAHIPHQF
jgi:Domain of unknown function (DUF4148)